MTSFRPARESERVGRSSALEEPVRMNWPGGQLAVIPAFKDVNNGGVR